RRRRRTSSRRRAGSQAQKEGLRSRRSRSQANDPRGQVFREGIQARVIHGIGERRSQAAEIEGQHRHDGQEGHGEERRGQQHGRRSGRRSRRSRVRPFFFPLQQAFLCQEEQGRHGEERQGKGQREREGEGGQALEQEGE